ncbi:hypothetical protein CMQ_1668 [Grosmannia clavigera kw1407]|uniref:Uncharacterized protein n=1 Tax=Grosmannia clavigera (strain kw1407 / UAMH 11150) TaxID=655863 RepID=F0XCH0_GROCL|nr:uncharacterized protein CMQ_1668 [Grosmannia clavigera kw1407]EFX04740.1 hypothetical protein CMQ_1668 [Grosmannia clavigera kw1407]
MSWVAAPKAVAACCSLVRGVPATIAARQASQMTSAWCSAAVPGFLRLASSQTSAKTRARARSTARFKAAPERTASIPSSPAAPAADLSVALDDSIAASQEAALAELKRLRLAATPTRLPPAVASSNRSGGPVEEEPPKKVVAIQDTPEFKEASRKWTSVIVAIPILLVSSYFLFERLVMGHKPKDLSEYRKKTTEEAVQQLDAYVSTSGRGSGPTKPMA